MKKKIIAAALLFLSAGTTLFASGKTVEELFRDNAVTFTTGKGYAGARRYNFRFEGFKAYFDEPSNPKPGRKWMWCMKWPGAFKDYTGQVDGVKRGYYYVYLDDIKWMNPEGVAIAKRFHDFLVNKFGFSRKAFLIGMSWGGFYSTRYAAAHPEDVARIYLDAPVMNFASYRIEKVCRPAAKVWGKPQGGDWNLDPRMPINLAPAIARAKIPVLLLYGGADKVVPPAGNCEIFLPRFKAAGGDISVFKRDSYAHHPHGFTDKALSGAIVDFFEGKFPAGKRASATGVSAGVFDGAKWIAAPAELKAAAPRFVKTFTVDRDGPAEIAICGLGQYVATINGRPVGRGDEFNLPGWSRTSKTCFYNVFRPVLKAGLTNTLEITLGNGMYNVPNPGKGLYTKFIGSEGPLRLLVGGAVRTGPDGWTVSRSKVARTHVYAGDDIDATIDVSKTYRPVPAPAPAGKLREAPFVCRLQETKLPVRTRRVSESELTLDFGQNAAYVPTVVARGPRGSRVEIDFSERPLRVDEMRIRETLTESGRRRAVSRCLFTLAGTGEEETFTVPFFYYGFRYMRVRLSPAQDGGERPVLVSGIARVVAADVSRAGSFECSNQLLNRIRDICWWSQRSNMQSVFTDCPHREKLGWQEQNHIHAEQIRWEWSAEKMFEKTCLDLADSQLPNGMCPDIAPEFTVFRGGFRHSVEWGSAMIQIPWQQYEWTGDDSLIRRYYGNMVAYHKYIAGASQTRSRGAYITPGGLGDWFSIPGNGGKPARKTSIDFMATVYYRLNALTLARCADRLGKHDEAKAFREEAAKIKAAFNAKWWRADGKYYENNTQTGNAIALSTGLADPAHTDAIIANIVADIRDRGNALTAGEIGFPHLLQVLAENGHSDVIADMMFYTKGSGYAYMIERGNTTSHEAWNARESVSHNHFMYADILNWFYGSLAGIKRTGVAFKTFTVAPVFLKGLDWVRAHHSVSSGDICVDWYRRGNKVDVSVVVPPGTTATVRLPGIPDVEQKPGKRTYSVDLALNE